MRGKDLTKTYSVIEKGRQEIGQKARQMPRKKVKRCGDMNTLTARDVDKDVEIMKLG